MANPNIQQPGAMQQQMQPQRLQPQQQQQETATYPKKKEDVETFASTLILALHEKKTRDKVIAQLKNNGVPIPMKIGTIVAMIISTVLMKIFMKNKKPHLQLILGSINMLVQEVAGIAKMVGVNSTTEERKQAAGIAGGMIEKTLGKGQAPPQPQQTGILQSRNAAPMQEGVNPGILGGAV